MQRKILRNIQGTQRKIRLVLETEIFPPP
uniref:Uncharacterized protein n=1 Tax=Arundo donax TaxID=35708 RepID=A0A0A9ADJ7_ARUDO